VLGERVLWLARFVLPAAGAVLVVLAYFRVRFARLVSDLTTRDQGRYWRSLSWEEKARYVRVFSLVSWAFSLIFIAALAYGVWCAYFLVRL